jgi:hypothetical protein
MQVTPAPVAVSNVLKALDGGRAVTKLNVLAVVVALCADVTLRER